LQNLTTGIGSGYLSQAKAKSETVTMMQSIYMQSN